MSHRSTDVAVVVGAGPYGLSIAAHLKGKGIPVRTFGTPLGSWRQMPQGMFLKSALNASSISAPPPGFSLSDFFAETGERPALIHDEKIPIDSFISYGLRFKDRFVDDVEESQVRQVDAVGERFRVLLDSGEELETRAIVLAHGLEGFGNIPDSLRPLIPEGPSREGPVSHSSQHHDMSALRGKRVALVGAGQSALEGAALLHEGGAEVVVLSRSIVKFGHAPGSIDTPAWRVALSVGSPLGRGWSLAALSRWNGPAAFRHLPLQTRLRLVRSVLGPAGAWWLEDRVVGRFPVRSGTRVQKACIAGDQIVLDLVSESGSNDAIEVDHVIAATGYRVDVDAIDFLSRAVRANIKRLASWPRLSRYGESSVPGLFFTSLASAARFGPMMRFVCGTGFAGPQVSTGVTRRMS